MRAFIARRGSYLCGSRTQVKSISSGKRHRLRSYVLAGCGLFALTPATAQETIGYTYDPLGRLVAVNHGSTGPAAGVNANYTYDAAGNRTNVTITTTTIALSPTSLSGATVGSEYNQPITASGGTNPYVFTSTGGLPPGLVLSSSGTLSGTPTTTGTYPFTVIATDANSYTGSQSYSVAVAAAQPCVGVSFAVANASANEGSNLSFTVTKSGSTSDTCTVNYATANGTAMAATNYTAQSGTLNFASGITSQSATVATIDDQVVTGALNMYLNLSSPSGSATVTTSQGTGTINNIDTTGTTTIQLTNATTGVNLLTFAQNNGYSVSSTSHYTFVVGSGVTITGAAGSSAGIDTGSWPAGAVLALTVNGTVNGGGGNGGGGGTLSGGTQISPTTGGAGGDAISCRVPINITINGTGTVQAGGGGGGGGAYDATNNYGGGGGGGGAPNGAGGAGGSGSAANGGNGSPGTTAGGGAGGSNGHTKQGGAGGAYARAGSNGASGGSQGAAGGAAGYAVRKNGTGCTETDYGGTLTGAVG